MKYTQFFPYGIALGSADSRPVFLMKDEAKIQTLAIWLTPIETTMAVAGLNVSNSGSEPHTLLHRLLTEIRWVEPEAHFSEVQGHHQYLDLRFRTQGGSQIIKMRADEAMSACVAIKCKFFASDEFVKKSRDLHGDMHLLEAGIKAHPSLKDRMHNYLM